MKDLLVYLDKLGNLDEKEFQSIWKSEKPVDSIFESMENLIIDDYNLGYHLLSDPSLNFELYPSPNSTLLLEREQEDNGKILTISTIEVGINSEFSYSLLLDGVGKENRIGSGNINNILDIKRLFNDINYML